MKCADLARRLFQVLPTASARRERPVTSTPPGGSALLIVSFLALKVIATGSNNWYDHTDWAGAQLLPSPPPSLSSPTAPPSSNSLPPPISRTNYQLVWSDEFNGTSVDASKWNVVGPWGKPVGCSNPKFSYSPSNVSVANGVATITVHNTGGGPGGTWTGGILSTDTTKLFQYGFVEVREKLPLGKAFFPAAWLYGGKSSDELDIMEFNGNNPSTVIQAANINGQWYKVRPPMTSGYHLFQMKWEPGRLTYYIDNVETFNWTKGSPARPMYLMLNFDVGGPNDDACCPDGSTPSPATLNVDYVRIYQKS